MRRIVLLILLIVIIFFGFLWWQHGVGAVNPKDKAEKVFVVERGAGVRAISNNLKKEGLINDPIVFFLFVKQNGADKKIQAGSFKLSPSMDLSKVVDTLSHGTVDVWVTIPEGQRAEEIADTLKENIPSYNELWREELVKNEGYLFPDTYLIPKDTNIETVISILRNNFDAKIKQAGLQDDPNLAEIIIVASLIEREALRDDEKKLISSVIHNRLDAGMALDIDATLQYAKGKRNGKWWVPPTPADKEIDSPYNTYQNPGLPPGPISNPGIEAIKAAANPAASDYYFYLHDPKGNVHFSKTIEQHEANINKYL